MRIVLDTNLLVALWLRDPRLPDLAQAWEGSTLPWATCPALFDEAMDVLMRPAVRRSATYGSPQVEQWLRQGWREARWLDTPQPCAADSTPPAPDPGDQFLWDLLHAHPGLQLWTRDKRLLANRCMRGRVQLPPEPGLGRINTR